MMKYDMDELLRNALSSKTEPDARLNEDLIRKFQEKERQAMSKKNRFKIPAVAALAVLALTAASVTGYATWKYLTPNQVAEVAEDQGLAAAFESEDAVAVNETQESGNYRITLLGIVSGKNLSKYLIEDEAGNVSKDRTYVVTAIENADGTPRPAISDDRYGEDPFFVSPLIQGLNPAFYNIVTMGGAYFETVQDGIQYRIAECDNVEKFADRPVYLCVSDGNFYNNEAYRYDEKNGAISRNEDYSGVNALFALPLDGSKADKEEAESYLKSLEDELNGEKDDSKEEVSAENEEADITGQAAEESKNWKEADFEKNTELVKELEVAPDAEGNFVYQYQIGEDGISSSGTLGKEDIEERDEGNMAKFRTVIGGEQSAYIETYTLKEDGSMLLRVYEYSR